MELQKLKLSVFLNIGLLNNLNGADLSIALRLQQNSTA